jgi:hypothetical protein
MVSVAGGRAFWAALALGLLAVALLLGRRISRDIRHRSISGRAGKPSWFVPQGSIRRAEDPFGFWAALGFNIFVLFLVVATIIAAAWKVAIGC